MEKSNNDNVTLLNSRKKNFAIRTYGNTEFLKKCGINLNHKLIRAKRCDNGEWIEGFPFWMAHDDGRHIHYFIIPTGIDASLGMPIEKMQVEIFPDTYCMNTGKEYMNGEEAYEGDIFESQASGDIMVLCYGTYQAFCPVDMTYMDSVGFYAKGKGYPDMPIGDLQDYALKKGNVFDNPELL